MYFRWLGRSEISYNLYTSIQKYLFVDSLSLLCLTCFNAGDVKWTTDDTGTIFHVNIFFRWKREDCSKSVLRHGWDPSLTVLVIGDDNQTWLERTMNCKATEVVWIVMDDDVKGVGVDTYTP